MEIIEQKVNENIIKTGVSSFESVDGDDAERFKRIVNDMKRKKSMEGGEIGDAVISELEETKKVDTEEVPKVKTREKVLKVISELKIEKVEIEEVPKIEIPKDIAKIREKARIERKMRRAEKKKTIKTLGDEIDDLLNDIRGLEDKRKTAARKTKLRLTAEIKEKKDEIEQKRNRIEKKIERKLRVDFPKSIGRLVQTVGDFMPPPIPKYYDPREYSAPPNPPASYDGDIRFGDRVEFRVSTRMNGLIIRAGKTTFDIILESPPAGVMNNLAYKNVIEPVFSSASYNEDVEKHIKELLNLYNVEMNFDDSPPWTDDDLMEYSPPGKFITFSYYGDLERGIVVGFTENDFIISVEGGGRVHLSLNDRFIKKIERKEKIVEKIEKPIEDIFDIIDDSISQHLDLRNIVVNSIYKSAEELIFPPKPEGAGKKEPVIPKEAGEFFEEEKAKDEEYYSINWGLLEKPKISFDDFYGNKFRQWFRVERHDELVARIPKDKLWKEAIDTSEIRKNPMAIIHDLKKRYGDDFFLLQPDQIVKLISSSENIALIDTYIKIELEKLPDKELEHSLTDVIYNYIRRDYAPDLNPEEIYKDNVNAWMVREFNKMKPTNDDRLLFDGTYRQIIENDHKNYSKMYEIEWEKAKAYKEKYEKEDVEKKKREELRSHVEILERSFYSDKDITVLMYLKRAMLPAIFLSDRGVGKYAKFFHAKIASVKFYISALDSATLAHYLPEVFMNKEVMDDDKQFSIVIEDLSGELYDQIMLVLNSYIWSKNPAGKKPFHPLISRYLSRKWEAALSGKGYIVDPRKVCQEDTGMQVLRDREGKVVHEIGEIPLADLIICYDEKKNTFSCHSTDDVRRIVSGDKTINPATGEPFPGEFVKKMRGRYPPLSPTPQKEMEMEKVKKKVTFKSPLEEVLEKMEKKEEVEIEEEDYYEIEEVEEGEKVEEEEEEEGVSLQEVLDDSKKSGKLVAVYFTEEWCPNCKQFYETWDKIVKDNPYVDFVEVDMGTERGTARDYNVTKPHIVIIFRNGKEISRIRNMGKLRDAIGIENWSMKALKGYIMENDIKLYETKKMDDGTKRLRKVEDEEKDLLELLKQKRSRSDLIASIGMHKSAFGSKRKTEIPK